MIRPPCGCWRFIRPNAPWAQRNMPFRLTPTTALHWAKVSSSIGTGGAFWPALLNRRWRRPNSLSISANKALTASGSPTSVATGSARRPSPLTSPATSSRSSRRRPASATCQPVRASASADAFPTPEPAPVTRAKRSPSMLPPLNLWNPFLPQFRRDPPHSGAKHNRAAEQGRQARVLAEGDKHPERPEHNIQKTDEARFRGRNELGPLHEEDKGEADRRQAKGEQDREIGGADRLKRRIGEPEDSGADGAEAVDDNHRGARLAPLQNDHAGEGERNQHRQGLPQGTAGAEAARDHNDDADEGDASGDERAGRDALAIDEEAHRRCDEGQGGVDHHHVGDGRRHHRGGVGGDRNHRQQRHERRQRAEAERVVEAPGSPFDQADSRDRGRAE